MATKTFAEALTNRAKYPELHQETRTALDNPAALGVTEKRDLLTRVNEAITAIVQTTTNA